MRPEPASKTVSLAVLAAACLLAACGGGVDADGTPRRIARQVDQALTTVAENELAADPELASRLGFTEAAAGYPFAAALTDRSQAAYERKRLRRMEMLDGLMRTPRPAEGSPQARHLDTVIAAYESAETLFLSGHGVTGLDHAYPYAADHTRGAWLDVPVLLAEHPPFRTSAGAAAWEARLGQFAGAIDDDRRRLAAEADAGIVPPAPILDHMITAAIALRDRPLGETPVLAGYAARLEMVTDITDSGRRERLAKATALYAQDILPAIAELVRVLTALRAEAPPEPGLWHVRDGAAQYDAALEAILGVPADAASLHAAAKADVAALTAQIEPALAAAGYAEGSAGSRLAALAAAPGQIYPDTDEGRLALLARLEQNRIRISNRLDSLVPAVPKGQVEIIAAPAAHAGSGAPMTYLAAPADQSAPARLQVDLSRLAALPDFSLATLYFHEAIPGHHLESALTSEQAQLPLARQLMRHTGFAEGWAAYAETLADESGAYTIDPLGRIGYLQSMLHHAARAVADTALHHEQWTRAETIAYLVSATGLPEVAMADEVDLAAVRPGEAVAAWHGRQQLLDLRETSMRVLGPDFDRKAFHTAVLTGGPRPFSLVETDVERWYAAQIE